MWSAPGLDGVTLFRARYRTHRFRPHHHRTFTVCAVEKGASGLRVGEASRRIEARTFSFIRPGEVHSGNCLTPELHYRVAYVPGETVARLLGAPPCAPVRLDLADPNPNDPDLASEFIAAHARLECSDGGGVAAFEELLAELVRRYFRAGDAGAEDLPHPAALAARDHLERHLHRNPSLDELAAVAGVSRYYLLRLFRAAFGLTPGGYRLQRRVERAKAPLAAGVPIADLAYDLGFADQSHFGRAFKAIVGLTPGQFARRGGAC